MLSVSKNYFNDVREAFTFSGPNLRLKNLVVFSSLISLAFIALYIAKSLYGRVNKKKDQLTQDEVIKQIFSKVELTKPDFKNILQTYQYHFKPNENMQNLNAYAQSEDLQRHAQTACIYYNSNQLSEEDALKIIFQREPTNIAMGALQYKKEELEKLFGYQVGIYNENGAKKSEGTSFKELPNTAVVYSETYLWNPPGGASKKEIACLSLSAPALDSTMQPHYNYYVNEGKLDSEKYQQEMTFLFSVIEKTIRDNHTTAFHGKGIKRIVLSRFGQGAFLGALSFQDQETAHQAYKTKMADFIRKVNDLSLEIVMSEYSNPEQDVWHDKMIIGDIIETAQEHDLIINAWDPHSAPGNGNDADRSFDGAMGKSSGILLTQTSWLNKHLRSKDALVKV